MMIGFPVGLLHFSRLSRSSRRSVLRKAQAIQQCGSTESNWLGPDRESREFSGKLNLWNTVHWQGMKEQRNYVLQTLDELWLSRQRYHSSSWMFVHIDYTRTRTLKLCFVLTNKIRLSPFHSHSLLDRLNYFLLFSQVMLRLLADVAHQMYRAHHYLSGFLSCALIIALSMWAWNPRDGAAFKDNLQASFLEYAAPRCHATMAASPWPRKLGLLKSCVNTGVAHVRKDSSQVRASMTVFSQATSGRAVEVTAADSKELFMGSRWQHNTYFGLPLHHWHFYPQPDTENLWMSAFCDLHFPIDLQPSLQHPV